MYERIQKKWLTLYKGLFVIRSPCHYLWLKCGGGGAVILLPTQAYEKCTSPRKWTYPKITTPTLCVPPPRPIPSLPQVSHGEHHYFVAGFNHSHEEYCKANQNPAKPIVATWFVVNAHQLTIRRMRQVRIFKYLPLGCTWLSISQAALLCKGIWAIYKTKTWKQSATLEVLVHST